MKRTQIKNLRADYPSSLKHIADGLIAEEREREFRDKRPVKFCPSCGRRPEIPFINEGRHIWRGYCEKCQVRFMVHVCESMRT